MKEQRTVCESVESRSLRTKAAGWKAGEWRLDQMGVAANDVWVCACGTLSGYS